MSETNTVLLPSKPRIVSEEGFVGIYEIDGLYPGYGHTLGNSLRRIIYSSLPGAAVTSVKINGVNHEFSTLAGIKQDVIALILNIKRIRIKMLTDEPLVLEIHAKGIKEITAKDIKVPGQAEILNPDLHIASLTDKNASLDIEMRVEKGLGFVSKEILEKDRVEIGTINLDGNFTPVKRVNYEVENMRVGDRTNFNRVRFTIETDGTLTPREALEKSIEIMIMQLKAIIGFVEPEIESKEETSKEKVSDNTEDKKELDAEFLKTRIETLNLSSRTINALSTANIRTVGGLIRKKSAELGEVEGLGAKGIQEIKKVISEFGIILK